VQQTWKNVPAILYSSKFSTSYRQ